MKKPVIVENLLVGVPRTFRAPGAPPVIVGAASKTSAPKPPKKPIVGAGKGFRGI
jgi:hypothetical protein